MKWPWRGVRIGARGTLVGALVYGAVVGIACSSYRKLLYPAPADSGMPFPPGATLRELVAADGVVVHALHFPAPAGARTVVHFHGNGETMANAYGLADELHTRGLGVLLVEYRGYGLSKGSPTEQGLYLDAAAALDVLAAEGTGPERVVLWGTSLGTGVAAEMAMRGRSAALILVTPYTSIPAVAATFVPFLPTSFIVGDRFDTLSKASKITVPTLILHGTADEIVPYAMGEELASNVRGAKLITIPGGHHNDLFARDGARLLAAVVAHARGDTND